MHASRMILCALIALSALSCKKRLAGSDDPVTGLVVDGAVAPRPPPVHHEPSADAVVVVPGVGIGPFALGTARAAVVSMGAQLIPQGARSAEVEGITLVFDADEPGGSVSAAQVSVPRSQAGVRVGTAVLANTSTYAEAVALVGPCEAPQANRGATITRCQGGALKIVQAGPAMELVFEVSR